MNGQGSFGAPAPDDPLIEAIRSLLPERSAEDRSLGIVRLHFGAGDSADTIRVPVLFHGPNQEWQEQFRARGGELFQRLGEDETGSAMLSLLTGQTPLQLELLDAFNPEMLNREWVSSHATEEQILDAFLGVVAASFPTPVALARVLLANRQVATWVRQQLVTTLLRSSTSSSPPSTGGARKRSTKG